MSWTVLLLVVAGSAYLMVSVGVTIHRRQHAIPTGETVSTKVTGQEVVGCFEELQDISVALRKHLERSHHVLGGFDSADTQRDEIQRWAEEGDVWRRQWLVLGKRCRLSGDRRSVRPRQEQLEAMVAVFEELGKIHKTYTDELKRFGRELAPRLGRLKKSLDGIGEGLASSSLGLGETE